MALFLFDIIVTQKELILFVENVCCFISVIGSAITTTILKREVFNVIFVPQIIVNFLS